MMEEAQSPQDESPTVIGAKRHHDTLVGTKKFSKKQQIQQGVILSEDFHVSKLLLPRYIDMEDHELLSAFLQLHDILGFQGWILFVSKYRVYYPQLVL